MPSKGKAKGNGWEREVADFLSDLYGESFVRVPNSGAFIGGKNSHRKTNLSEEQIRGFKGDIIPGPSFPNLNLEAKFYKDFAFHQVAVGACKQLDQWIEQMKDTCDETDVNLLTMKFNRKGAFVAFEYKWVPDLIAGPNYMQYNNIKYDERWLITEFNTFWNLNSLAIKELSAKAPVDTRPM